MSKWKTVANAGAGGTWATSTAGIHTTKNVGIATTARSNFALYVEGNQYVDGNITVGGTMTYEDVKNVDSLGIVTARTGVDVLAGSINVVGVSTISTGVGTVHVGVGSTALLVEGDARVTGILTVGNSSVTIDGNNNIINVGTGITLNATTGIIEAPQIKTSGTSGALFPPVLTTAQRDALSVTEGAMIFNTTTKKMNFYDGTNWICNP